VGPLCLLATNIFRPSPPLALSLKICLYQAKMFESRSRPEHFFFQSFCFLLYRLMCYIMTLHQLMRLFRLNKMWWGLRMNDLRLIYLMQNWRKWPLLFQTCQFEWRGTYNQLIHPIRCHALCLNELFDYNYTISVAARSKA
jgi:hypothetical protein